ncbi:MAG: tRNA uridine-5-carboxymethylaminomethyl(34) synthesis GTPase MnmE [Candidatus Omnitrophota bacterium]|jgi:tRNA modification GTPase
MVLKFSMKDTIAAIATAPGVSAIGIIKISGSQALEIADRVFIAQSGVNPSQCKSYTVHYGWVVAGKNADKLAPSAPQSQKKIFSCKPACLKKNILDEAILTVMRAPKSYTREDVVEISCHGGYVAARAVLGVVLEKRCRLAEPGEFTKRAFLNGRIDLSQAEAVLDIIKAKTDSALKLGLQQLEGVFSRQINSLRDDIVKILALIEVQIDFPEEYSGDAGKKELCRGLEDIHSRLSCMLEEAKHGQVYREGIHVVICGMPNTGKSSLLNALLRKERSIVTSVAGTTRDIIEEVIDIKGIPVRIVDTAGIIEPRDLIERKAVKRSRQCIDSADLVIAVFDAARRLRADDKVLMRALVKKKKVVIAVLNKIDLKINIQQEEVTRRFPSCVALSAKKSKNINLLERTIVELVQTGRVALGESRSFINTRHQHVIAQAHRNLKSALCSLREDLSFEYVAQDIKDAVSCLDELLGKRFSEDVLDKIFNEFCIGK